MSRIRSRKLPVARAGALMVATVPGLLMAADGPDVERTLGSIRVAEEVEEGGYKVDRPSSPKFTADLVDIPQTVTVIGKALLADQGVGSLSSALLNTPGITFTLGENGNSTAGDSINMRGFDASGSIFLDGIRDLGAVARDTFNVEQVEIVKGPSGSDNGRSAPTGYVNQATKQPTLDALADATLALGTDNRVRVTGDVNHALSRIDGAALRLNVMFDRADAAGRTQVENRRWGIAPSFALGLGGETRAYVNYLHMEQDNRPDGGLPTIGLPGYRFVAPTTGTAAVPADIAAAVEAAVNAAPAVKRANYYGSPQDHEDVSADMLTLRFEHDLSASTGLVSTSRYGRYTLRRDLTGVNTLGNLFAGNVVNSPEAWTVSRSRQRRDELNEILANQTLLTAAFATGGVDHALSTGVELLHERQESRAAVAIGTTMPANLYAPSRTDSFAALAPSGAATDGKSTTAALFLFDTLSFGGRWKLNMGLRLDHYEIQTAIVPAPSIPPAASSYLEDQGNLLTGKVGLMYKPMPNGTVYFTVANSQQPPGGTNFALNATATNIANPNFDPQEARNIELGTRWELLDSRLVVSGAAFDTRNRNEIAAEDPVTGELNQFGQTRVRGIEVGVAGMITPAWQVNAGLASLDTEVLQGTATTTGAQLRYTPRLTFTSWTTYSFASGLTIGGGARYTDAQYRNANATQATVSNLARAPRYWVVDAMARYGFSERVSLQFNAYNLFDEFYLNTLNNGGSRYVPGPPRSFQLGATIRF